MLKISHGTLLNSGLSIGISSKGKGEKENGTIRTFLMYFPSWLI